MKKKILFMVQVPPPVHGAALRNKSLVDSKLLQDNFHIRLLPLSFVDSIEDIGKISTAKILKALQYSIQLLRTLISFRPSIAYFTLTPTGGAFYRDCFFVAILKMFNVSIIYHLRGLGINKARQKNTLNKVLYNFVFRNAYVVCLSQKHLLDVAGLSYKKHFVVPNGIKVEAKPEWGGINGFAKRQLLFLSNFVKSKGVFEFLEALKQLKALQIPFEAQLVGADYDVTLGDIQNYINQAELTHCVKVTGPKFKEEKFKIISSCDIFVFPTYYSFELFPGVILEAMQCGKPVISTYHGVIEDILDNEDTGLLVAPKNVNQLVEKITYLIKHPEQAKAMGERAQRKFYQCYTLDKFEQNVKAVFDEV